MYAPTAAGVTVARRLRASEKMTNSSPSVAMISENECAGDALWWAEMLIALSENITLAAIAPRMHPATCAGRYARVAPSDPAEMRVDKGDDRVEVPARDRSEHEDDREQASRSRGGVFEQLQADVSRRELLSSDPRPDHQGSEERRAQQLRKQAPSESVSHRHAAARISQCSFRRQSRVRLCASVRMWLRIGTSS